MSPHKSVVRTILGIGAAGSLLAASTAGTAMAAPTKASASVESCVASTYGEPQMTATGERFNPRALTAASKTLPLNSNAKVTNTKNGKSVIVRINDRGPYVKGRCIDLSTASMDAIGGSSQGLMNVRVERV